MNTPQRFIVIDDDLINNVLCRYAIGKTKTMAETLTFNISEKGFDYIATEYPKTGKDLPTVLFLDINMPSWTGWDFLDHYDKLDEKIKKQIKIYMLSSSIDPTDMKRAHENKNVVDYIVKPLSPKVVLNILNEPKSNTD